MKVSWLNRVENSVSQTAFENIVSQGETAFENIVSQGETAFENIAGKEKIAQNRL